MAQANFSPGRTSDTPLDWKGCHRLTDLDALERVKADIGPDLVIQGSSTLYPQLLARGLLDRLVLMIAPITLGSGKRLFGDGVPAAKLKLAEQRHTPGGWVIATYELAEQIKTGSFTTAEPSDAERIRRTKIKAGEW